jgi:hypothetical protein
MEGHTSPGDNEEVQKDDVNICSTPTIKSVDFDKTEVQNQIDELNLMTDNEQSEKDTNENDTEILNEILLNSVKKDYKIIKSKSTTDTRKEVMKISQEVVKKGSEFEVINQDPYLKPFENKIKERIDRFKTLMKEIETNEGDFFQFCRSYKKMGIHVTEEGIKYTEYAPGARALSIVNI